LLLQANQHTIHIRRSNPRWEELEKQLCATFEERRKLGRVVRRKWFERISTRLFTEYPYSTIVFRFSDGWFTRSLHRNDITQRRSTSPRAGRTAAPRAVGTRRSARLVGKLLSAVISFLSRKLPTLRVMRMKMRMVLSTTFVGTQMSSSQICKYCTYLVDSMDSAVLAKIRSLCTSAI
jgi:hypothetical protein